MGCGQPGALERIREDFEVRALKLEMWHRRRTAEDEIREEREMLLTLTGERLAAFRRWLAFLERDRSQDVSVPEPRTRFPEPE